MGTVVYLPNRKKTAVYRYRPRSLGQWLYIIRYYLGYALLPYNYKLLLLDAEQRFFDQYIATAPEIIDRMVQDGVLELTEE